MFEVIVFFLENVGCDVVGFLFSFMIGLLSVLWEESFVLVLVDCIGGFRVEGFFVMQVLLYILFLVEVNLLQNVGQVDVLLLVCVDKFVFLGVIEQVNVLLECVGFNIEMLF